MSRRVDITELYRELQQMERDSYVLCFDVVNFDSVNKNYGRKAGDAALREVFHRVDSAAGDTMPAFRIGGDEFAIVTGLSSVDEVNETARRVIDMNGKSISFEGKDIPLSVRVSALKLGKNSYHIKYSELFDRMQNVICETRDLGKVVYFDEV